MAPRQTTNYVQTDVPLVTTAETVAVVSDPITPSVDGAEVTISGALNVTTGTNATSVNLKIRRGTTTAGAQVGETIPITIAAAASGEMPFSVTDFPGAVSGQQYNVTVTQVAASANGAVNNGAITVASDA